MLLDQVDFFRMDATRRLNPDFRSELGQFMTPAPTARLMASMFDAKAKSLRVLDPGAGVGSLSAALVDELTARKGKPADISLTAYEIDPMLCEYLEQTLAESEARCQDAGIEFHGRLRNEDFIEAGCRMLSGSFFAPALEQFDCAILNPPYKKINSDSRTRSLLREIGVETSNVYTGFLAIVLKLLAPGGEIVAITPRSFCNGPYFKSFRKLLLETVHLTRVHVFESRTVAFSEDAVLQENVIFHGVKGADSKRVVISSSNGPDDEHITHREVPYSELLRPADPEYFIHIVADEVGKQITGRMARFSTRLEDLKVTVSTGRVVDFRATKFLRQNPDKKTVPLIYPGHFSEGFVRWPREKTKKPNAIAVGPGAEDLLVPSGHYTLTKRFSAKEEPRRVVAAVFDPKRVPGDFVGFENHLNYFHRNGRGLPPSLASGLAVFLNSTLVDLYFRQFNGHTQVNATDLRNLKYPTEDELVRLGARVGSTFPGQDKVDEILDEELFVNDNEGTNPVATTKRVQEALSVLESLGLPRAQLNERSALTLLALLCLKPNTPWADAGDPFMGITPMMDFFREHYGKDYKPNTRETVRRQTVHQFLDAALIVLNPDNPERPTNSPDNVYQIEASALKLLRTFGTSEWENAIRTYLASVDTLKKKYAQEREMKRIPLTFPNGKRITLSPGGQNVLVEKIIEEFCARFTPGGDPVYVGDTDDKFAHFDRALLKKLGVDIEEHGKMPDVVIYYGGRGWLVLIEAVTSHGPVNPKRHRELTTLFKGAKPGLIFVTAFLDRKAMVKYLGDISWETEVWVADAPGHLIHFNGERFLGPYSE